MGMLLPNRQYALVATVRKEYVLDVAQHDRACIDAVCSTVLDAVLPEARTGTLDGFHDEWPEIPKEVVNLREQLRHIHGDDNPWVSPSTFVREGNDGTSSPTHRRALRRR
jgi:hypothetical protein